MLSAILAIFMKKLLETFALFLGWVTLISLKLTSGVVCWVAFGYKSLFKFLLWICKGNWGMRFSCTKFCFACLSLHFTMLWYLLKLSQFPSEGSLLNLAYSWLHHCHDVFNFLTYQFTQSLSDLSRSQVLITRTFVSTQLFLRFSWKASKAPKAPRPCIIEDQFIAAILLRKAFVVISFTTYW